MRASIFLLLLFLPGCNEHPAPAGAAENHVPGRLDYGAFTLSAPGWTKFTGKGLDSYVGGLIKVNDTLWFDYGWYSHQIDDYGDPGRLFAADTIDGFMAIISIPSQGKDGAVEMNIDLEPPDRFTLYGDVSDIPAALSIFASLHFKSGHPERTRPLTLSRFVSSDPPNGKAVFQVHCSTCHGLNREVIGAKLSSDYVRQKGEKWIAGWLSQPDKKQNIPGHLPCGGRGILTARQIQDVIDHLKSRK